MADVTSNPEIAERVFNLYKDILALEVQKKDATAGFADEIKRVKAEIKQLIEEDKEANGQKA